MKFTEVRSTVPLSDADFTAIRTTVLADIQRRRRPARVTWVYAFAAVAVLLPGLSVLLTVRRPIPMPAAAPRQSLRSWRSTIRLLGLTMTTFHTP